MLINYSCFSQRTLTLWYEDMIVVPLDWWSEELTMRWWNSSDITRHILYCLMSLMKPGFDTVRRIRFLKLVCACKVSFMMMVDLVALFVCIVESEMLWWVRASSASSHMVLNVHHLDQHHHPMSPGSIVQQVLQINIISQSPSLLGQSPEDSSVLQENICEENTCIFKIVRYASCVLRAC